MRIPRPFAPALASCLLLVFGGVAAADIPQPAEGLWHVTGRVGVTACAGHCESRHQTVDQQAILAGETLSGTEGLTPSCPDVTEQDFAGLTELVPARNGWYRLRVLDRPRLAQLMARCVGYHFRLGRFASRVRVAPDGHSLDERFRVSGHVRASGRDASLRLGGRVHGDWLGPAAAS